MHALSVDKLRMNELARKIDITATEASRQIQRLLDEGMIQKQPDGVYTLTSYGQLVLHFFPTLEFIQKHKQYLLIHDIWQFPKQFISRIGELSQGTLCMEVAEVVNKIENMMQSSNDHVWVITDQVMTVHINAMKERISKGVKFRSLIHERMLNSSHVKLIGKNVERRVVSSIPALVVVTEKEAFVSLLTSDGKLDSSGFYGSDQDFIKWVTDLFLFHWDHTKRGYSQIHANNSA